MKCKIETLTPCHIGSGVKLIKDIDFVKSNDHVGILSSERVYALLGDGGVDKWCNAIERGESVWSVIKTQHHDARIEDACSRTMVAYGSVCKELSVQLSSNGVPYIPGSSIKGAIVSAIVGACREKVKLPSKAKDLKSVHNIVAEQVLVKPTEKKDGKIVYDPKNSNLRFLRVGDAYFDGVDTVAIESYSLNLREKGSIVDKEKAMFVECIDMNCSATFDLQLRTDLHQVCGNSVLPLPEVLRSEQSLIAAINSHTLRLLEEELRFWEEQKSRSYYHVDSLEEQDELDDYICSIKDVIEHCKKCKEGEEAILRIGYGSGWNFTTGGWIDCDDEEWKKVLRYARPEPTKRGNSETFLVPSESRYAQYDFPKTRRVGYAPPFGFVKISRLD